MLVGALGRLGEELACGFDAIAIRAGLLNAASPRPLRCRRREKLACVGEKRA